MDWIFQSKNYQLRSTVEDYARSKLRRIEKMVRGSAVEGEVMLKKTSIKNKSKRSSVQISLEMGGVLVRVEETAASIPAALDLAVEKLLRQLRRFKSKKRESKKLRMERQQVRQLKELDAAALQEEISGPISRKKKFDLLPMSEEEAIEQMELLDHDFFVFLNKDTKKTEVVYRRREGTYGQLIPEKKRSSN